MNLGDYMAHVFIVDNKSLKVHLNYMFAGTGAKDYECDFLVNMDCDVNPSVERLLAGMIADISRIRIGDNVIFYLQQNSSHEGMFFGSFKVKSLPFLSSDSYLEDYLGKKLTFRVELESGEVYSKGITERECLDSLDGITHPYQMCWSLIYRKLKGNRGCTMISDYEYNSIMNKIRKINNGKLNSDYYDFDSDNYQIVPSNILNKYNGSKQSLDIYKRLYYKYNRDNSFESHLQAFILQNLENIKLLINPNMKITWIGNEVSCGVGMQSIDIAFIEENESEVHFNICELKYVQPKVYIKDQIEKYIVWMKDYIIPTYNKPVVIKPIIIAPYPKKNALKMYNSIKNSTRFCSKNLKVEDIKYVGFSFDDNSIKFEEVKGE